MADVIPFRAVRPPRDKVALVGTRSYITYTPEERIEKLHNNPYSFLHIIHPEGSDHLQGEEKFEVVRQKFLEFIKEKYLVKDRDPAYYIYSQETRDKHYTGIIGGISIKDYEEGNIKKHEHTITRREEMFKEYLGTTLINAEPVLLTYPESGKIEKVLAQYEQTRAEYEFTTTDRYKHKLWLVNKEQDIELIREEFGKIKSVYIADGHHRSASSSLLGKEKRAQNPEADRLPTDYFSAYLISDRQMEIKSFHRLVRTLNGRSEDDFITELKRSFTVEALGKDAFEPQDLHSMGLYMNGNWYKLAVKNEFINFDDPVEQLDCYLLSSLVLKPLLGIKDEKTDKNVTFKPAPDGIKALTDAVDGGDFSAAFTLPPVTVNQLKNVADENLIMPPKSTWVEPKLRSGITIYDIDSF